MPIILVVDDSPVDRKLIEGLLKSKLDWIIEFAENGAEGLELVDSTFPDVVITDLQMPQMSGLELCSEIKMGYPHVPVILVTGKGSEDMASQALAAGAASYVCKDDLSAQLVETVEQVLKVSRLVPLQEQLMLYNTQSRFKFTLDSNPALLLPLVDFLSAHMEKMELGDSSDQRHCAIAFEEALINALFHGNLELDPEAVKEARRALHHGEISAEVQARLADPKFRSRRLWVGIELSRRELKIIVRDEGLGFSVDEKLKSIEKPTQLVSPGGRGLTLITNFMDEVTFDESGNELKMALRFGERNANIPEPLMDQTS